MQCMHGRGCAGRGEGTIGVVILTRGAASMRHEATQSRLSHHLPSLACVLLNRVLDNLRLLQKVMYVLLVFCLA